MSTSRALFVLSALLLGSAPHGSAQTVGTLAGSGDPGFADGTGAVASFHMPHAVAVGASGDVYVADVLNSRIRKVTPQGAVTTFFGTGEAENGPGDILPWTLTMDPLGDLYVVDFGDDRGHGSGVKRLSPDGIATGLPLPSFLDSVAVAVAPSGELYVLGYEAGLYRVRGDGTLDLVSLYFGGWSELATDGAGNVYVASSDLDIILKATPGGTFTILAGSLREGSEDGIGAAASFRNPAGLAVDASGHIYVADADNNVIRRITPEGVVTTYAGSGSRGRADGVGRAASFDRPTGVALDCVGNLYVADSGNNLIRVVTVPEGASSAACQSWIVPSVARVAGAHDSFWTSELTVHNRGAAAVTARLKFLGNGEDTRGFPEASLTLEAHESRTIPDVLASVFGISEGFGALQLFAGGEVVVRSRTASGGPGGSIGDNVPGVRRDAFFRDDTAPKPVLSGLREDEAFRTNLVLVNGAPFPITLVVSAVDASGAPLGERSYDVPPLGMLQDSRFLARPELGGAPRTGVAVTISSPTAGAAFIALATVIDNVSNDPTTVLPW